MKQLHLQALFEKWYYHNHVKTSFKIKIYQMDFAVCGMRPHKDVKPVIKMLTPIILMKERKYIVHSAKKVLFSGQERSS